MDEQGLPQKAVWHLWGLHLGARKQCLLPGWPTQTKMPRVNQGQGLMQQ